MGEGAEPSGPGTPPGSLGFCGSQHVFISGGKGVEMKKQALRPDSARLLSQLIRSTQLFMGSRAAPNGCQLIRNHAKKIFRGPTSKHNRRKSDQVRGRMGCRMLRNLADNNRAAKRAIHFRYTNLRDCFTINSSKWVSMTQFNTLIN